MASQAPALQISREDRQIALLASLAVAIHILESGIPSPVPGVKPGLANIITLLVLFRFGWRYAAWVSGLRVLAGSLLIGTFMSPTFFLSLAGATASMLAIGVLWLLPKGWVGVYGISILAAVSHVCAQLVTAWLLFVPHSMILGLLPVLIAAGIIFGIFNAIIVASIQKRLTEQPSPV
jgi:heptaprenyl diphosphate synthase